MAEYVNFYFVQPGVPEIKLMTRFSYVLIPSQRCINSIDRSLLNERLLDEVSARDSISLHFQNKLTTADFDRRVLTFDSMVSGSAERVQAEFDLCIGADGSYSNVRRQMMRVIS